MEYNDVINNTKKSLRASTSKKISSKKKTKLITAPSNGLSALNYPSSKEFEHEETVDYEIEESDKKEKNTLALSEIIEKNLEKDLGNTGKLVKGQLAKLKYSIDSMFDLIQQLNEDPIAYNRELIIAHKTSSDMVRNFVALTKLIQNEFSNEQQNDKIFNEQLALMQLFLSQHLCSYCHLNFDLEFRDFLLAYKRKQDDKNA